jgi:hypothetical protein
LSSMGVRLAQDGGGENRARAVPFAPEGAGAAERGRSPGKG